jgi:hypothetical protein
MVAVIWGLVRPYALQALLVLAAIGTVLAVLARVKHAGRMQERTEAAIAAGRNLQRQAEARAKAPRTPRETSAALRKGKF